jgi:hypothetical protein
VDDHLQRLAQLSSRHGEAQAALARIVEERAAAIREAHDAGIAIRAIADAVGLSFQRVGQIIQGL